MLSRLSRHLGPIHRIREFPWTRMVSYSFLPTITAGLFEGWYVTMVKESHPWLPLWAGLIGSTVTLSIMIAVRWSHKASLPYETITIQDILDDIDADSLESPTEYQIKAINRKWRGKRIRVSGRVENVHTGGSEDTGVPPEIPHEIRIVLIPSRKFKRLFMTLSPFLGETMHRINMGDILTVRGSFFSVSILGDVEIIACEIISRKRPWRIPFLP